jgi:hypothetical protein
MTKEDDPDLYNEYKDIIRGVQMQISMLESGYEEVKN